MRRQVLAAVLTEIKNRGTGDVCIVSARLSLPERSRGPASARDTVIDDVASDPAAHAASS